MSLERKGAQCKLEAGAIGFIGVPFSIKMKMTDPSRLRNDPFMNKGQEKLKSFENELLDDDPLDSDDLNV